MGTIRVAIEGRGAVEATEELVAMPELVADWEPIGGVQRDLTLATIVTIIGIVGTGVGVVDIVEKLYQWYQKWSQGEDDTMIEKALIVMPDGTRLLLENASREKLIKIVEQL